LKFQRLKTGQCVFGQEKDKLFSDVETYNITKYEMAVSSKIKVPFIPLLKKVPRLS